MPPPVRYDELWDAVLSRLEPAGWATEARSDTRLSLAHRLDSGLSATLELWSHPSEEWRVIQGVGYPPATRLAPVLGIEPVTTLLQTGQDTTTTQEAPHSIAAMARVAITLALELDGPEELHTALTRDRRALSRRLDLLVAAGMGRLDRVEAALARPDAAIPSSRAMGGELVRRRVRRWLDAGGPQPSDADLATIAMPERIRQPPSVRRTLVASGARRDARQRLGRYSRQHPDAGVAELRAVLARDHVQHGIESTAIQRAGEVEHLLHNAGLRGGITRMWAAGRLALEGGGRVVTAVRESRVRAVAEWMAPPHPGFMVPTGDIPVEVGLDPGSAAVLERAAHGTQRRLGSLIVLTVWLDRAADGDGAVVHLGEHAIGSLPTSPELQRVLAAADFFDERPRLHALLLDVPDRVLEVSLPAWAAPRG